MPLACESRSEQLADLVQHVGQVGVGLEGGEQDDGLRAEAAGLGVPAGELDGGGGFALAGVGVQQDDGVVVEGAVEQQQGFVAADEAGVGHVAAAGRGWSGRGPARALVEFEAGRRLWAAAGGWARLRRRRARTSPEAGGAGGRPSGRGSGPGACGLRWRPGRRRGPWPGRRRAGRCIGRR